MKKTSSEVASLIIGPTESLELSGVERFSDDSGYCGKLTIRADEFSCISHTFYFSEFPVFVAALKKAYASVAGEVELRDRYEPEFVRFQFTPSGHLEIDGLLLESSPRGCRLEFSLDADQSFCPSFIQQLESISKQIHG